MIEHSNISIPWSNISEGFAFVCMKTAYQYGITGKMNYGPAFGAGIEAEGEQTQLAEFFLWILKNVKESKKIKLQNQVLQKRKYSEFDIEYFQFPD